MTKIITKAERRKQRLEKHYSRLEKLAKQTGGAITDGKKLSLKLWRIETEAHMAATAYCNGQNHNNKPFTSDDWDKAAERAIKDVQSLFPAIKGLNINGDARGYALKIRTETMDKGEYDLEKDWGGFGILSPEINGNA